MEKVLCPGGTLILLGEAAQLLHAPLPYGWKDPRIFSPDSTPSSTPNARRGKLPQGWHGFRFLLRGYWVAWAAARAGGPGKGSPAGGFRVARAEMELAGSPIAAPGRGGIGQKAENSLEKTLVG